MAAGNDDDEGGGGDGDPEVCASEPSAGPAGRRSLERALEEAASTGVLNLSGRRMKELPGSARNCDLTDVTRADLSRNRLSEVPVELCHLVSLESLTLYHNCLRSLTPALCNLQVLTYLNISRNLLTSLPPHICRLPLTVLIASNNKLSAVPEEVGAMSSLRQLDISCNDLQSLPAQMGSMRALRELNVRRNQLTSLPEEISALPLTRLDFSCNRVSRIPTCYRHLRHLQSIVLDNNPLQYPPAQICLKGKVHIFKYLNIEACSKPSAELGDLGKLSRPTSFTTGLTDDLYSQPYGGLDSGFNSVDSGSKRWSGNESADELSDLSFRVSGLGRQFKEKLNGAANGESEQLDFIDSSTNEEEGEGRSHMMATPQEKRKPHSTPQPDAHSTPQPDAHSTPQPDAHSTPQPDAHSTPRPEERTLVCGGGGSEPSPPPLTSRQDQSSEERRRPETLSIWKERERQQQLLQRQDILRRPSVDRRDSLQKSQSSSSVSTLNHNEVANPAPGVPSEGRNRPRSQGSQTEATKAVSPTSAPTETSPASIQRPNSFLFRSCSRGAVRTAPVSDQSSAGSCSPVWLRTSFPRTDEKAAIAQLRKELESRLNISLEDPLCESLSNGVALCQLLNHLRPRTIPIINVPSPAVPKLNLVKCRKNVDSFLDACRRLGVPERDLCSPSDILGGDGLHDVLRTVSSVLPLLLCSSGEASSVPGGGCVAPGVAATCPPLLHLLYQYHGFLLFYTLLMLMLYVAYSKLCPL